jgi:hypothetical protein
MIVSVRDDVAVAGSRESLPRSRNFSAPGATAFGRLLGNLAKTSMRLRPKVRRRS